ncbi:MULTISPECIES: type-F conjugative transfer system pilin assembly protein TrbC [Legionella]|uniref:Type-F conjugative transfer system pilin assembly protein TrbC n=2 Tax=Legionella TaxID=445 RepID=A0A9X2CYW0_9GAMM|nr:MULTISPECIES: type-F conjugative transfer system pilin assembly protein TrbC [Legionella]KTC80120.1 putative conjugative transfer protein TrbC [Legionella cherrii]MCL9682827.1 type-F conjugative transfer system pilin assembly protein TrbC [Legionella maioricensis]MCL9686545.1 type-F conjugative transfer system pilin assembly protein TrbC [Legionella maioricensis]
MNPTLLVVLFLFSASVFAADEAYIASVESNARDRANAFTQEVKQISKNLEASEKSGQIAEFTNEMRQAPKTQEPIATHLKKVGQVLVFLSFSMPERSLQAWLLQCKRSGAIPVIRGLIHNSFKETMTVLQALSQKTGIGMQLDPILFKTFEITAVPAVVYVKDVPLCPANMDCKPVDYDKLYGDVSLDYALEKMDSEQAMEDPALHQMILLLKGEQVR